MTSPRHISLGSVTLGNDLPMVLIAGPCAMESRSHVLEMASALKDMCKNLGVGLIFKSSYDKANRTSADSPRGVGMKEALPVFSEIRESLGLPVITDVHEAAHCAPVAEHVDALQIPAFLCRQTDLLLAAGKTGRAVNVKKGQFLAPWDMSNIVKKIESCGNSNIMLCERGTCFGYNRLISDMRALPELAATGCPVVFDATHSVQEPGGQGATTGGDWKSAPVLARAAVSVGIAAVFIETHDAPEKAFSDGPNMIPLNQLSDIVKKLIEFDKLAKS